MEKHEQSIVAVPSKSGKRRRFSELFKREVVEQTLRADVSIASVALANGLNINLLARWHRDYLMAQDAG
jgi:transposase